MELGVFLPISGSATGPDTLAEAAQTAEAQGFDAVWSADRVVTPWKIQTTYPYSESQQFIVPPEQPFLDSLTCLAFLAGVTKTIRLGVSVLVLPYRHPLYWTRVAASIERLSKGRLIMGVGVGWMEEEFAALGVPFRERGRMTDEQLEALTMLWRDEHISYSGQALPVRRCRLLPQADPAAAHTRLGRWRGRCGPATHGTVWRRLVPLLRPHDARRATRRLRASSASRPRHSGATPTCIQLTCCRPIEVTSEPVAQDAEMLRGSPEQLVEALHGYRDDGVAHLALQFMVPRWPDRVEQIARFAAEVLPHMTG